MEGVSRASLGSWGLSATIFVTASPYPPTHLDEQQACPRPMLPAIKSTTTQK